MAGLIKKKKPQSSDPNSLKSARFCDPLGSADIPASSPLISAAWHVTVFQRSSQSVEQEALACCALTPSSTLQTRFRMACWHVQRASLSGGFQLQTCNGRAESSLLHHKDNHKTLCVTNGTRLVITLQPAVSRRRPRHLFQLRQPAVSAEGTRAIPPKTWLQKLHSCPPLGSQHRSKQPPAN